MSNEEVVDRRVYFVDFENKFCYGSASLEQIDIAIAKITQKEEK